MSVLVNILLVVNVFVCIALIAVVLIQRSEGGALGMGGGGGPSGFLTTRGAGDLLTRITWILASIFFVLSMAQTLLAGHNRGGSSVVDRINVQSLDLSSPAGSTSSAPAAPASSSAPPALQAPTPTVQTPQAPEPVLVAPPAAPKKP